MKRIQRIAFLTVVMCMAQMVLGQTNVISNNKPLGFMNASLSSVDSMNGIVSASYIANPLSESSNYSNYVVLTEFRIGDQFAVGAHGSSVDTRLNKREVFKIYGSFKFEFEQGNFFHFGLEGGLMNDQIKLNEYNKVFSPTTYNYTEPSVQGLDLGVSMGYTNQNLTVAIGLSQINRPSYVVSPRQRWTIDSADSTAVVKNDTVITYGQDAHLRSGLNTNVNVIYTWSAGRNLQFKHFVHVANLNINGYGYAGFQTFATMFDQIILGAGIYNNGNTSFMANLGYQYKNRFKVELSSFFKEEYEFNPDLPYPVEKIAGYSINALGDYESVGVVPSFELSTSFAF